MRRIALHKALISPHFVLCVSNLPMVASYLEVMVMVVVIITVVIMTIIPIIVTLLVRSLTGAT